MSTNSTKSAEDTRKMSSDTPVADETFDFSQYWRTIVLAKWKIILFAIFFGLIGGLVAKNMTPMYQATSKILADPQKPSSNPNDQYVASALVFLFYETQYEIIKSRNVAEAVVEKLNLVEKFIKKQDEKRDLKPDDLFSKTGQFIRDIAKSVGVAEEKPLVKNQSREEIKTMLALNIQSNLNVSGGKQSQVINVSYSSSDPKEAAEIINAVADAYISFGLASRLGEVRSTEEWLGEQYEKLGQKLQKSEIALSQYRTSQGLVETSQQQSLANSQLQNLNNELINAQTKLSDAAEQYRLVNSVEVGTPASYSLAPVLANKTASEMVQEQASKVSLVRQLEQRYGEKHPKMVDARAALKSTQETLNREVEKIFASVVEDYQASVTRVNNVRALIEETRSNIQNLQDDNLELVRLEREVENNRRVYESFQSQLMQANINSEFDASNIHIIDRATIPKFPYKPNVELLVLIATVLGAFVGIVYAFAKEAIDNTFKTPDSIEEKLQIPTLGISPIVRKSETVPARQYFTDQRTTFSENINSIRTGLLFSDIDNPPKTILVTSSAASEGKSTLAINLAAAFSNIGKTLLIEVDLRKPSLSKYLGLNNAYGLTELVTGTAKSHREVSNDLQKENLSIIAAGEVPLNPAELLASRKFEATLSKLREEFDYIIMDGPPILPVSDSLILGNKSDAVILAIRAEVTKFNAVKETIKRLKNHSSQLTGAVLTMAATSKMNYYGASYYSQEYYGERDSSKLKKVDL